MVCAALVLVGGVAAYGLGNTSSRAGTTALAGGRAPVTTAPGPGASAASSTSAPSAGTTVAPTTTVATTEPLILPTGPVPLAGCPPPPPPPPCKGSCPPPGHPGTLVPDAALPPTPAPTARVATDVIAGKGMWIWVLKSTESGDVDAIVAKAKAAGLRQLWVRVADSWDGFYGGHVLDALAPKAHAAGLSVVGWGFPYFYDPVGDATWTSSALAWRGTDGRGLDAFSPDIETAGEGVMLTTRRVELYLSLVRRAATGRPIVATVFPPTDRTLTYYPFQAMAPYVDAFAPMVYWGCVDPGQAALQAITRLAPLAALAPLHLIGQAYDMGPEGGRRASPSRDEILRFLDVADQHGATGASFYVWQDMTAPEWAALSSYPWHAGHH
jgi:hypothetical protein